jgi:hypothetical protein
MAFNANQPQPGSQISSSQPILLANFQAINTIIDPNNSFINLVTTTPPLISSGIGLYSEVDPRTYPSGQTALNEMYFKRNTAAGVNGIPLTGGNGNITPVPSFVTFGATAVACGWYNLPNELWVKYGYITGLSTVALINLDLIGPLYETAIYNVQVSSNTSVNTVVSWGFPDTSKVQIGKSGSGTPDCYFFVIGQ